MTNPDVMKKAEELENAAQDYFDKREKMFDLNDFSKEVICTESYKSGYLAALQSKTDKVQGLFNRIEVILEWWARDYPNGGEYTSETYALLCEIKKLRN